MKLLRKSVLCAVLLAIITAFSGVYCLAAQNNDSAEVRTMSDMSAQSAIENLKDPDGYVTGISHRGLWHEYPENSLAGIKAAADTGIRIIETDINVTSDGILILFADDTAKRMLGEDKKISEMTYAEISALTLKNSSGGDGAEDTEYTVPTLRELFESALGNDFAVMLNTPLSLVGSVSKEIHDCNADEISVLYINAKAADIENALSGCENKPEFIAAKRSNIIFSVTSFIEKMYNDGALGVNLMTTNRYGVNFSSFVLSRFENKLRAVADTSAPETCGARQDTQKWWNDLLSRGYSVIITDYPELFVKYTEDILSARDRLSGLYEKYTSEWQLPQFKSNLFNDYKKAYDDAVNTAKALLADKSNSLQDINDCCTALQSAVDDINLNYTALKEGTAGMTVSVPRILLCVGAAIAVIAVQIFFWKKRKK